MTNAPRFLLVGRWVLGILFLWAAASKLANPIEFLGSIYAYDVSLPDGLMKLVAVTLPWIELICGLLLMAGVWTETALSATTALLAAFVLLTGQAWLRGLSISCGCFNLDIFGLTASNSNLVKLVESVGFAFIRNLLLLGVSLLMLRSTLRQGNASLDEGIRPKISGDAAVAPHGKSNKQLRRAAVT